MINYYLFMRGACDFLPFKHKILSPSIQNDAKYRKHLKKKTIKKNLFPLFRIKYADANKYVLCCYTLEKRKALAQKKK